MTSPPNREYNKMLRTPVVLKGPCKDTIDAINKQMDVHFEEIRKLRSAHNSHVPVSRLPAELLSEVFLCIVESSLPYLASGFARGTFMFRQVCRHWDEVAVGFPQLWVQWLSRAVRAWPLFNTRSKEAPIFLKWQPYHAGEDLPADTVLPGRIRQLEFIGTREQSEKLFRAVDSSAPSNASSIRIYITSHPTQDTEKDTQAHLARFLSSPLPKLSKLNITNYQPDCSSAAFTTSSLTSLRLSFPAGARPRYTLAQFSRILQKHPNLRGLDLEDAAVPQVESTEAPVPFTLPQLDVLKLRGTPECILRVVYLIGTTSPLHHIALHFDLTRDQDVPASVDAVKKVLTAYYEHGGLDHPRRANHITVSGAQSGPLCFIARSQSTPGPSPQPLLELRFSGGDKLMEILPLFPLKDTQEFTINGLLLTSNEYYRLLQQVEGVSQLRLSGLDIKPVLKALYSRNRDKPCQQPVPKLVTLTLSRLDFLHGVEEDILDVLRGRRDRKIGLKRLSIQSCRVHRDHDDEGYFEGLVEEVEWIDVEDMGTDYEGTDEDPSEDESDYISEYRFLRYHY